MSRPGLIERIKHKIPCLMSKGTSFVLMTFLLGGFFLVEVCVGYLTNAMALIADSFHMLSDVASLVVGYVALKLSTASYPKDTYTYGYARAEVLGALVNAVFLVAISFSIFIESLKRLVILEPIEDPVLVFFVGLGRLIVNIFGMFLFHQTGHGHSHGGVGHGHSHGSGGAHGHSHGGAAHGHSHGGSGHGHSHGKSDDHSHSSAHSHSHSHSHGCSEQFNPIECHTRNRQTRNGDSPDESPSHKNKFTEEQYLIPKPVGNSTVENGATEEVRPEEKILASSKHTNKAEPPAPKKEKSPAASGKSKQQAANQLNMKGVYLHILGDALGSICVMISALLLIYGRGAWTLYVDPSMSIVMVLIILKTSIPLLVETSRILMNSAPQHLQIDELRERLLSTIPEIKNVHELHVWQLAGDKIIATVHLKFESPEHYEETAAKVKDFFHDEGIHSTTVQLEFVNDSLIGRGHCMVVCSLDSTCDDMMCCKPTHECQK